MGKDRRLSLILRQSIILFIRFIYLFEGKREKAQRGRGKERGNSSRLLTEHGVPCVARSHEPRSDLSPNQDSDDQLSAPPRRPDKALF